MSAFKNIWIVYNRELKAQFNSMLAYVFIVIFVLLSMSLTFLLDDFFAPNAQDASLENTFFRWPMWLLMFLAPAVGMRLWSEEQRTGTIELLLTMPLAVWHAIVGKYLAALSVITIAILFTFPVVITVAYLGDPDNGTVWGGYLACIFYGGGALAITCAVSALTRSSVACLIIALSLCFGQLLIAIPPVLEYAADNWGGAVADVLGSLGTWAHYTEMKRGVISFSNVVFYLSMIGFCLFLTSVVIKSKRS